MTAQRGSNISMSGERTETADSIQPDPAYCHDLIQHLPQAVFETDAEGRWSFLNRSWRQLTGFDVDRCIGDSYQNYVHPQDRARCREVFRKLQDGDIDHCSEAYRFLVKDGDYLWTEVHAAAVTSDDGFRGVVGTLINITDRVSEEELLLADQRTLTAMLNELPGMVYRCRNNPDWTMEYVSGSSLDLTGYRPEDIMNNKTLSYGSMIHPEDQQLVWNEVQNAVREDRRFEIVYRIITADHKEKWVWERGKGVFSSNDELLGLEGFITDISSKKRADLRTLTDTLYDSVTELPTTRLFEDRIEFAIRRARQEHRACSLLVIHLDRLNKTLEQEDMDVIEHSARSIGHRLAQVVSSVDTVSRLDYERWGILVEGALNDDVSAVAQRIQDEFLRPVTLGTASVFITVSIGIARLEDRHQDAQQLLRDAGNAMHRAHELGGGRYEIYDTRIHQRAAL